MPRSGICLRATERPVRAARRKRPSPAWDTRRAVPPVPAGDPQFAEHFFGSDDTGDDSVDDGPTGGLTWDGRVDRIRDQARIPLFSSYEMANVGEESVVAAAQKAGYSEELGNFPEASRMLARSSARFLKPSRRGNRTTRSFIPTAAGMMRG